MGEEMYDMTGLARHIHSEMTVTHTVCTALHDCSLLFSHL
jgi:hypothetical protein